MTLNFQSQASYVHESHTKNLKFKGQSVQKIRRKEKDGQTDATKTGSNSDCFIFPTNADGKN